MRYWHLADFPPVTNNRKNKRPSVDVPLAATQLVQANCKSGSIEFKSAGPCTALYSWKRPPVLRAAAMGTARALREQVEALTACGIWSSRHLRTTSLHPPYRRGDGDPGPRVLGKARGSSLVAPPSAGRGRKEDTGEIGRASCRERV